MNVRVNDYKRVFDGMTVKIIWSLRAIFEHVKKAIDVVEDVITQFYDGWAVKYLPTTYNE